VKIRTQGIIKDLPVTGLTADTNYGVAVYMRRQRATSP
jgi:hypothetical protein